MLEGLTIRCLARRAARPVLGDEPVDGLEQIRFGVRGREGGSIVNELLK